MAELSQGVIVLLIAGLTVILVQHGWNGVKAKLSAIFLGKPRPDLVQ